MNKNLFAQIVPDAEQRRIIAIVLLAGTAGGFASWAYGLASNNPVMGGYLALPVSLFFGAFAAGVGVFVLANTDTTAVGRLIFFAALCGFAWKPVIDAGSAFVKQSIADRAQAQSDEAATDQAEQIVSLAASLTGASPEAVALQFQTVTASLTDAMESASEISDPKLSRQAQSNLTAAVRTLAMIAPKAPNVTIPELQKVSTAAEAIGDRKISAATTASLNLLAATNKEIASVRTAAIATNPVVRPRPIITKRVLLPR
jgi:hypothetical protein